MFKKGMKVLITGGECCAGLPVGSIGVIAQVDNDEQILVKCGEYEFWQCSLCAKEI